MEISGKIITCDQEWSHEELYGVAYDECARACKGLDYLLDMKDLDKPYVLLNTIMAELGDKNLVDKYNEMYASKSINDTSNDVFERWDKWMMDTIQDTLRSHKYKYYVGGK